MRRTDFFLAAMPLPGPWPLPALLCWAAGWAAQASAAAVGAPAVASVGAGALVCCALAWRCGPPRRRLIAAAGFPVSALALGAVAGWPPWIWLLALAPLLAAYPPRAWRDAPFFPTPARALDGLDRLVAPPHRVLDAGCGLGHGLAALRSLWPAAELHGVEWSAPLAAVATLRRRDARVRRGDMWAVSWAGFDVVYVFQRPESMSRVFDKASRELGADGWLVSLEFAVPGREPVASVQLPGTRPLWIYRPAAQAAADRSTPATAGR